MVALLKVHAQYIPAAVSVNMPEAVEFKYVLRYVMLNYLLKWHRIK